jgi:hypothetical protein
MREVRERGRKPLQRNWFKRHKVVSGIFGAFLAMSLGYAVALTTITSLTGPAGGKTHAVVVVSPVFVEVTAAEITTELSPGQTGGLVFHVNNPNFAALTWTELTCANLPCDQAAVVSLTGSDGSCNTSNFTFLPATGLSVAIAAGPGTQSVVTVPGVISMAAGAPAGCNNATVEVDQLRATFVKT